MDLGLEGRYAIVCASSAGLGKACAVELARAGCTVVINGRDAGRLEAAAADIRAETGATVIPIIGDIGLAETQDALISAVPQVDIMVNNNGGPPFRDFREVNRVAMLEGVSANMVTPIELIQRVIDGMVERCFGRIVNITSGSVKMPLSGLDLSSGARLGLTGFLAGVARSVAHANVTINFLLPGSFDTDRQASGLTRKAEQQGVEMATIRAQSEATIPAKRFGEPAEFGAACAFLCSAQAGFITGQSLLIDGGAFPGVL
jgi:3-oxoacyl-[acyl-carrier protein] reductase